LYFSTSRGTLSEKPNTANSLNALILSRPFNSFKACCIAYKNQSYQCLQWQKHLCVKLSITWMRCSHSWISFLRLSGSNLRYSNLIRIHGPVHKVYCCVEQRVTIASVLSLSVPSIDKQSQNTSIHPRCFQGTQLSVRLTTGQIVEQQDRCQHAITLLKQDVYALHAANCRLNAEHTHLPLEHQASGFVGLPILQKLAILRQLQQACQRSLPAYGYAKNDI